MDSVAPFLVCFAIVFYLLPMILSIVAMTRVGSLRREVDELKNRLADATRELLRRPVVLVPREPHAAETVPPVSTPEKPVVVPVAPVAHPQEVGGVRPIFAKPPEVPAIATQVPTEDARRAAAAATFAQTRLPGAFEPARTTPKSEKPGLEAYLGTRLFVVIGAIALALAGIYLVQFAVEHNYLDNRVRVIGGILAGFALLSVAQWRRTKEPFIAQGLSAAGIVALYAAFLAASRIYHMIPNTAGFFCLAAVTALAVVLSLQQGPLIAALGLIGGFLTPVLIGSETRNVPGLFGYLLLLHVGLVVTTRWRGWTILAAMSVLASSAWMILWLAFAEWSPGDGVYLGTFMLVNVFALVLATLRDPGRWKGQFAAAILTWIACGSGLFCACFLLARSGYTNLEWGYFALLVVGAYVIARIRSGYEALAWVSAAAVLGMLLAWAAPEHWWTVAVEEGASGARDLERLKWLLIGFGVLTAGGAYGCLWRSAAPVRWGLLSVLLTLAYVAAAYWILPASTPRPEEWALLPLIVGALLIGLTVPIYRKRVAMVTGESTLAIFAHGVLGLWMMAPPMALEGAELTAGWAALLALPALVVWRLRIHGLLWGFFALFALLAGRCLALGWVMTYPAGPSLWWNPVIWTYGSVLLAVVSSLVMIERAAPVPERWRTEVPNTASISAMLQAGASVVGLLLLSFEVRWYFHQGLLDEASSGLVERGMYALEGLLLAGALLWLGRKLGRRVLVWCGQALAIAGLAYVFVVEVLAWNPLWTGDSVGTMPVLNLLLFTYGVPIFLAWGLSRMLEDRSSSEGALARIAEVASLLLVFVLVTLEVRQYFQGEYLNAAPRTYPEMVSYSLVWAVMGATLLVGGIWRQSAMLRWASLVLMFLTVFKVFVFDMSDLKDLLRVLSFAGLGVSLMGLAFVYQHYVFRKPAEMAADKLATNEHQ